MNFFKIFFSFLIPLTIWTQLTFSEIKHPTSIQWQPNYEKALEQARGSSKALLLFFTGSDWCGWCSKLEQEVLSTYEFFEIAGQHFIFVRLDFPLYSPIDPQIASLNKELRKKFDIRSFPMVVLIDENQQFIGSTGFRADGGREYGNHLLRMVNDYKVYQGRMLDLNKTELSELDLQKLYEKARQLQRETDVDTILKKGLASKDNTYFLKERFRYLAEEGKIHEHEALKIKQQLLARDPLNQEHIHYDLAMIEFETYCTEMEKSLYTPETVVAPLTQYVDKFHQQDQENTWRILMIISQVYLDSNKLAKALQYAKQSYESAPSSVKPDIQLAINNIQAQITNSH